MVLFGATGDLSGRKILPALFALWQGKFLPEQIAIVGVAIEKYTDDQFRDLARKVDSRARSPEAGQRRRVEEVRHAALLSIGRFFQCRQLRRISASESPH